MDKYQNENKKLSKAAEECNYMEHIWIYKGMRTRNCPKQQKKNVIIENCILLIEIV